MERNGGKNIKVQTRCMVLYTEEIFIFEGLIHLAGWCLYFTYTIGDVTVIKISASEIGCMSLIEHGNKNSHSANLNQIDSVKIINPVIDRACLETP